MKQISYLVLLALVSINQDIHCIVSTVYNLRIAQTTREQHLDGGNKKNSAIYVTPVGQFRKKYNETKQTFGGALGTYLYYRKPFYAKIEFAAAHLNAENPTIALHTSHTQTDDILITSGFTHRTSQRTKFTVSGLLGLPTHHDTSLDFFSYGTGHVGLGCQADNAYKYSPNRHHSIMSAVRYVYFFPRTITLPVNDVQEKFDYHNGNLVDLLIVHNSHWNAHIIEVGYNPTFYFGAHSTPEIVDVEEKTNYFRSSFFAAYQCLFSIKSYPNTLIFGASYGFDMNNKTYSCKNITTIWMTWGINF